MSITRWIGDALGLENVRSIDHLEPTLAARWAQGGGAWVLFGCLALGALAAWFYYRFQPRAGRRMRLALAISRGLLLSLLLLILADPVLTARLTSNPRPLLYLLFDGTDSMAIEDELPADARARLREAVGAPPADGPTDPATSPAEPGEVDFSRAGLVRALIESDSKSPLAPLAEKFRLRAYVFDRPDAVRAMRLAESADAPPDGSLVAAQLTTDGQVTALGRALDDLGRRHAAGNLAGVVVFSDFAQNAGPAPLGSDAAPARKLGVPVYTVGVGTPAAADLGLALVARPMMKKAERDTVSVQVRQAELDGREVTVRLTAQRRTGDAAPQTVGERIVKLSGPLTEVAFPFMPDETGRFEFAAEVEPLDEEVVEENNRATREVNVRDDFLRLMYVAYEPTWEWRFIKEVFHRDKLVGIRGFRTFLRSSDPKVRRTNELFLPSLTPSRSEFFANDVVFLGEMPSAALSTRFCEMVKEYVSKFGGGLVVLAGPRFGPGELARTPLADLLPVVVDPDATLRDQREFRLQLTPEGEQVEFMRLGRSDAENRKAWANLGRLPWYQPVARPHPLATVLAEFAPLAAGAPTDRCVDGATPQPLIAVRKYGKGEVVYLGMNETWRLRRKYGEKYYRQFWGQLIYHLGLGHALGNQKRFVVRTDRPRYRADDVVTLAVEAYDENFDPLDEESLPDARLEAELTLTPLDGPQPETRTIRVPRSGEGLFEARIPVLEAGSYRVAVRDPVTREESVVDFRVESVSVERQSAVRNVALQEELALVTGGRAYDLETVAALVDEVQLPTLTETSVEVFPLWCTWLVFGLVVLLMLGEWLARKWVNLP